MSDFSVMWLGAHSELRSFNVNFTLLRQVKLFFFGRFYKRLTRWLMGRLVAVNSVLCKMEKLELEFIADSFIFISVVSFNYLVNLLEIKVFQ